jgi:hypothetical protein
LFDEEFFMSLAAAVTTPKPSRRRRYWLIALSGFFVAGAAVMTFLGYVRPDLAEREAVAEADRLDAGWRMEDLVAARQPVPDAENSAHVILAAAKLIPATSRLARGSNQEEKLAEISPEVPLEDDLRADLKAECTKLAAAVDVARRVAKMPRGRYDIVWAKDGLGTLLPHVQEARTIAGLLAWEAVLRADRGDIAGAMVSVQAALNTGRSIGDEPTAISQLVRIACDRLAVRSLERMLAQGQAPAPALLDLQNLALDEAKQPLQLIMARADRAAVHQFLEFVQAGNFNQATRASYSLRTSVFGSRADDFVDRARARGTHGPLLRYLTQFVEIAKLPTAQQQDRLEQLQYPTVTPPMLLVALTRGSDHVRLARSCHTAQALLRCASVALAAERFRLEHQRWPESLTTLVPAYLSDIPTDPYDGQPLRLRRVDSGIVIYSVGPDREDNGGNLDRSNLNGTSTDVGFQLWDLAHRPHR